jgi:hypothetical protein
MELFIFVFLSFIYNTIFARRHLSAKFGNVIIDRNLKNDLFSRDKQSRIIFPKLFIQ